MSGVIFDLSRLISRVRHVTPSGVDRVEMAYARGLLAEYGDDLAFAAVHPSGLYGRLSRKAALDYLAELERRWSHDREGSRQRSLGSAMPWLSALRPVGRGIGSGGVYVQVSPHHLTRKEQVRRILAREKARYLVLVHDLIPIEYPEYARPGGAELHARRMESVGAYADAVIVNSQATGASLTRWLKAGGLPVPPLHVALLGTEPVTDTPAFRFPDGRPFFLCLGTIEPRKNHLLLLHLWRQMAVSLPPETVPRLVVVGRRGWENEQIVDLLDRCEGLRPHMTEINRCPDSELAALLRGARALVMPSFAEGYGMPIAEALSAGIPVIASDLPAHREVGGAVPDYLDPLDGPGWRRTILDHAKGGEGSLHAAQQGRLACWQAPDWSSHMATARKAIESLRG